MPQPISTQMAFADSAYDVATPQIDRRAPTYDSMRSTQSRASVGGSGDLRFSGDVNGSIFNSSNFLSDSHGSFLSSGGLSDYEDDDSVMSSISHTSRSSNVIMLTTGVEVPVSRIDEYRMIFDEVDIDRGGSISASEMKSTFRELGVPVDEVPT